MKDKENKLIALFMGLEEDGVDGYLVDMDKDHGYQIVHESCFLYNSSWDWLMPVVEKIEQDWGGVPNQLMDVSLYSTIDEVYEAVLDYIKTEER